MMAATICFPNGRVARLVRASPETPPDVLPSSQANLNRTVLRLIVELPEKSEFFDTL